MQMTTQAQEPRPPVQETKRPQIKGEPALDAFEAAKVVGYSRGWVLRRAKTGGLPCYRPSPRKIWFLRSELEAWLAAQRGH